MLDLKEPTYDILDIMEFKDLSKEGIYLVYIVGEEIRPDNFIGNYTIPKDKKFVHSYIFGFTQKRKDGSYTKLKRLRGIVNMVVPRKTKIGEEFFSKVYPLRSYKDSRVLTAFSSEKYKVKETKSIYMKKFPLGVVDVEDFNNLQEFKTNPRKYETLSVGIGFKYDNFIWKIEGDIGFNSTENNYRLSWYNRKYHTKNDWYPGLFEISKYEKAIIKVDNVLLKNQIYNALRKLDNVYFIETMKDYKKYLESIDTINPKKTIVVISELVYKETIEFHSLPILIYDKYILTK